MCGPRKSAPLRSATDTISETTVSSVRRSPLDSVSFVTVVIGMSLPEFDGSGIKAHRDGPRFLAATVCVKSNSNPTLFRGYGLVEIY